MLKCTSHNAVFVISRWEWVALFVVVTVGLWHNTDLLMQMPVAVGLDGYYYVLQVDSLKENGHLYFSTKTPFIFYALTVANYLIDNTVDAIKISSIGLHTLLCLGVCSLITGITRHLWLGVIGGLLIELSNLHVYMITEFISSLGSVTLLIWCGWSVIYIIHRRFIDLIPLLLILLLAAIFSHKSALLIAISVAFSGCLLQRAVNCRSNKNYWIAVVTPVLFSWLIPAIIAVQSVIQVPQWLADELSFTPRSPFNHTVFSEIAILLMAAPLILFVICRTRHQLQEKTPLIVFGTIALWSLMVTLNPFLKFDAMLLGITWRLRSLAYIQISILVPGMVWLTIETYKIMTFYATSLVIPLMIWSLCMPLPQGARVKYLENRMEMMATLAQHRGFFGSSSVVMARHGDQFVVASVLKVPSQWKAVRNEQYQSIYWLLHRVENRAINSSMLVLANDDSHSSTILVSNGNLQALLHTLNDNARLRMFLVNPHLSQTYYPVS